MRKYLVILLSVLFLAACGGNDGAEEPVEAGDDLETVEDEETAEDEEDGNLEVDKGLFNVEVTLPASLLDEEMDMDELKKEAEEIGIKEVNLNDNGSVTYKMPKSVHKEWLEETATELDGALTEMVESGDFVSIKDILANNDYSEYTMTVDGEAYENSFDSMATLGIGISGAFYQLIDGSDPENYSITIHVVDEASGDTIESVVFPDDLDLE